MSRCLEIGPGVNPLYPDWETLSSQPGCTYQARWGFEPLPLPDAVFSQVYASHVLEHIPWFLTREALLETRRILEPGGLLEVWVPDFAYIIECYRKKRCGDQWRKHNPAADSMTWVNGRIFTYGPGEDNWHHAMFDRAHLLKNLREAGFTSVTLLKQRTRGTSHGKLDLGAVASK